MAYQTCQCCGFVENNDSPSASAETVKRVTYCDFNIGWWQRVFFLCDNCANRLIHQIEMFIGSKLTIEKEL